MLNIKINNEPFGIFTQWNEVPLINYAKLLTEHAEEPTKKADKIQYMRGVLGLFSDIKPEYISALPGPDLIAAYNRVVSLLNTPFKGEPVDNFTFRETVYHCYKELPNRNGEPAPMREIPVEEAVESLDLINSAKSIKNGEYKVLPELLAILYRPEGMPYDEVSANDRRILFENLPVSTAMAAYFFFADFLTTYIRSTPEYLFALRLPPTQQILNEHSYSTKK